jgi:hypothetical protein
MNPSAEIPVSGSKWEQIVWQQQFTSDPSKLGETRGRGAASLALDKQVVLGGAKIELAESDRH